VADRRAIAAAMSRVQQARSAADGSRASDLAGAQYRAALALDADGQRLARSSRPADALTRLAEAEGRFRSAAIEAQALASVRPTETTPSAQQPEPPPRPAPAPASVELSRPEPRPSTPAPETAPPPPVTAAAKTVDAAAERLAETQVREVIAQYVSGFEGRNIAALKRVWPGLAGAQERAIQNEFSNARAVQIRFTEMKIDVNGDTATMNGIREYSLMTQDGQRLATVSRTTIALRRNGDAWHIDRVVYQPR
jgi:hypothetical protein